MRAGPSGKPRGSMGRCRTTASWSRRRCGTSCAGAPTAYVGEVGLSQSDVVMIMFAKKLFSERYVERLYKRIIGAEIPPEERARAVDAFEKDAKSLAASVKAWVLSPVYVSNAK